MIKNLVTMDEVGLSGGDGVDGHNNNNSIAGGNTSQGAETAEPTFAEKMLSTLRSHIENGQAAMGAQGHHSNNTIVNPLRNLATQDVLQPQPSAPSASTAAAAAATAATAATSDVVKGGGLSANAVRGATVVSATVPMSPRSTHAMAAAAHAEARRKRRALEDAKHKKERDDKLSRYLALIVCIVVIILSLLGMAAISRRVIGKWWHGAPDDPTPPSVKISHSPLFPFSK